MALVPKAPSAQYVSAPRLMSADIRPLTATEAEMKALVYHGPGSQSWDDVPGPVLVEPGDAIVRVDTTTICGTDLHIMKGDVATVTPGRVLGQRVSGRSSPSAPQFATSRSGTGSSLP